MKGILEAIKLVQTLSNEEINSRLAKAIKNRNKRDKHNEEFEIYLPTEYKEELGMENITVFKFENGKLVKEEWTIGDNKESENEKVTIKDPRNIHEKDNDMYLNFEDYNTLKRTIKERLSLVLDITMDEVSVRYDNLFKLYEQGSIDFDSFQNFLGFKIIDTKKSNFENFKEKCMQDKEVKKEYDKLQPEYDKIKEDIEKGLNKNRNLIVDNFQDLTKLIGQKTDRNLYFDIDKTESMMSCYVRSGGRNMRIILQDIMLGFEDPNKYLSKLVEMLYSLGFNVELSKRLKMEDKKEFERISKNSSKINKEENIKVKGEALLTKAKELLNQEEY